jgi:hypothetical protein
VWDALRDFGALHERLVRGFVVDATTDGTERVVTFANGAVVRELLVSVDDDRRRLAYAIVDGFTHYQGTATVVPAGAGSRLVWEIDLLPDDAAPPVAELMAAGADAMRRTLT